jgi:hypothetical protein
VDAGADVAPPVAGPARRGRWIAVAVQGERQGKGLLCKGNVPYLLERYLASGLSANTFADWLENFRGSARPQEDIGEYLSDAFGIALRDLMTEMEKAGQELRYALQTIWYEAHRQRRTRQGVPIDEMAITRLVEHDVECYCGVTGLRTNERASPFGYSAWWLTLDRRAFNLKDALSETMKTEPPDSPVLSADFLVNYLAFGPVRRKVAKSTEAQLPLVMSAGGVRFLTPELLAEAEALRATIKDLPERLIRRRVRDHLDNARRRIGPIAQAGVGEFVDELIAS